MNALVYQKDIVLETQDPLNQTPWSFFEKKENFKNTSPTQKNNKLTEGFVSVSGNGPEGVNSKSP